MHLSKFKILEIHIEYTHSHNITVMTIMLESRVMWSSVVSMSFINAGEGRIYDFKGVMAVTVFCGLCHNYNEIGIDPGFLLMTKSQELLKSPRFVAHTR